MSSRQTRDHEAAGGRSRFGGCGVVWLLLVLGIFAGGSRLFWPALWGKPIRGRFICAVAVPSANGQVQLWLLTDGSFRYTQKTQRPGSVSVESKCLFCRTWTYVYDPVDKAVRAEFRNGLQSVLIEAWMAYASGRVWVMTGAYENNPPTILVYETDPPRLVRETKDYTARFPELGSGLIGLRFAENPPRIVMDTRDGRSGLALNLVDERLYPSESRLLDALAGAEEERVSRFALGPEDGSGPRRVLFKVAAARRKLQSSALDLALYGERTLAVSTGGTVQRVLPGRVFIEGLVLYQDAESCLILHQDAAGRAANRLLTFVDARGSERWTTPPETLFEEMKLDERKNAFSKMFFLKSRLRLSRSGRLLLLQLNGVGLMGLELQTGRKLWQIRL